MVTVTPFMGNLKVHIGQLCVNDKGEKKPDKKGMTLELEEFDAMVRLIPQIQESIARYELRDTGISSSPFELDLPVLYLDMGFLIISTTARAYSNHSRQGTFVKSTKKLIQW